MNIKMEDFSLLRGMKLHPSNQEACLKSLRKMMKPLQRNARIKRVLEMEYLNRDQQANQLEVNKTLLSDLEKQILKQKKLMSKGKHANELISAQDILESMSKNIGSGTKVIDDTTGQTVQFPDGSEFPFSNLEEQIRIENKVTDYLFNIENLTKSNKKDKDKYREMHKLKNAIGKIATKGRWFGNMSIFESRKSSKLYSTSKNLKSNKNSLFQLQKHSTNSTTNIKRPSQTCREDSADTPRDLHTRKHWDASVSKIMSDYKPRLDRLIEAEDMLGTYSVTREFFASTDEPKENKRRLQDAFMRSGSGGQMKSPYLLILPAANLRGENSISPPKTPSTIHPGKNLLRLPGSNQGSIQFTPKRHTLPLIEVSSPREDKTPMNGDRWRRLKSVRYFLDSPTRRLEGSSTSRRGEHPSRCGVEQYQAAVTPRAMKQMGAVERQYFKKKLYESEAAKMAYVAERCRHEVSDNIGKFGELFSKRFKTEELADNKVTFKITKKVFLERKVRTTRNNLCTLSSLAKRTSPTLKDN